jgi:hypothetical protein
MDNFIFMDDLHPPENLVEDIECLLQGEDFITELALNGVKITHIAILHY